MAVGRYIDVKVNFILDPETYIYRTSHLTRVEHREGKWVPVGELALEGKEFFAEEAMRRISAMADSDNEEDLQETIDYGQYGYAYGYPSPVAAPTIPAPAPLAQAKAGDLIEGKKCKKCGGFNVREHPEGMFCKLCGHLERR